MLRSPYVFVFLIILSLAGLVLGVVYYFYPAVIVKRRVKGHHWEASQKDVEFRKWLEAEMQIQIKRVRQMGMVMIVMEAIWFVLIISLWQKSRGM